jgi:zinc/manganese transport system substrate-binding protein
MATTIAQAVLAAALALLATAGPASAAIRVTASTNDLASIAASVGGERVEVTAVSRPAGDPHRVEVLPSYMVRVSRAQLYLKVGLGLDQWADAIIDGSHNAKLVIVDCSQGVNVLEKPTGKVDASMGDVHPAGNPHYWLDPRNGAVVARTVAAALARLDPAHADEFEARATELAVAADAFYARGRERVTKVSNTAIVTYHRSWSYFADAFGFEVVQTIEPIPGIPPTARHLQELVDIIRGRKVGVVLEEPYFSEEGGEFLKRQTGVRIVSSSASCDAPAAGSYLRHLETVLERVAGGV